MSEPAEPRQGITFLKLPVRIATAFGLAPFVFREGELHISQGLNIYSTLLNGYSFGVGLLSLMVLHALLQSPTEEGETSGPFSFLDTAQLIAFTVATLATASSHLRGKSKDVLALLRLVLHRNPRMQTNAATVVFVLTTAPVVFPYIIAHGMGWKVRISVFSADLQKVVFAAETTLFLFLIDSLTLQFTEFNRRMDKIITAKREGLDVKTQVQVVRREHQAMAESVHEVCSTLGTRIALISIFETLVWMKAVFQSPESFNSLTTATLPAPAHAFMTALWCTTQAKHFVPFCFLYRIQLVQENGMATLRLVQAIWNEPNITEEELLELELFATQIHQRPVRVPLARVMTLHMGILAGVLAGTAEVAILSIQSSK